MIDSELFSLTKKTCTLQIETEWSRKGRCRRARVLRKDGDNGGRRTECEIRLNGKIKDGRRGRERCNTRFESKSCHDESSFGKSERVGKARPDNSQDQFSEAYSILRTV